MVSARTLDVIIISILIITLIALLAILIRFSNYDMFPAIIATVCILALYISFFDIKEKT